jgi:Fe-S oxidoreductase
MEAAMGFECSYYLEPLETENLTERFLDAFAAILNHSNYAMVLEAADRLSTKCARCSASCPVYEASGEKRDIPCDRTEKVLKIYRRYFTARGVLGARLSGGTDLTQKAINDLAEDVYRCTACRRCKLECPMGIDHGLITHMARWVLAEVDIIPKALVVATREQLEGKTKNTSAIPKAALIDTCEFLEEDCVDDHQLKIEFPIDQEGKEYVFFPAVSDYLLEPDTLMGNAAVMSATQGSWTIGTGNYDGINYGLFYSDRMLDRIVSQEAEEVRRLGAKKILIGECGHASRSAKYFVRTFCGADDAPEVVNFMEYTHQAWKEGRLKLRANAISERVTYHDPCNIARSGWIIDQPREILRHICADFVEMTPNGRDNYCCGGGGGTVSIDEIREFRTKVGGAKKAEQVRRTGAELLVAPCANCKKQLAEVCEDHGLTETRVVGLHDLILLALEAPDHMKVSPTDDAAPEA